MIWVRRVFVQLFAVILLVSLLGGVVTYNLFRVLGQPGSVKELVSKSGVYDQAIPAALDNTQKDSQQQGDAGTISLSSVVVQQAAVRAFNSGVVQESIDNFIDGNYTWLKGQAARPDFSIDLTKPKQDFASIVGQYVSTRLSGLPACSVAQLSALQPPFDVLSISCRPPAIDAKTAGTDATQQILNSQFLTNPVITADNLGRDATSQEQPYYARLSRAPEAYKLAQKIPYMLAGAAVVAILLIILVAPTRRKGARRIAFVLLLSGGLLIVTKFASNQIIMQLEKHAFSTTLSDQLAQPRSDFLHQVMDQLSQFNVLVGAIFVAIAVILYIALLASRNTPLEDDEPQGITATDVQPVPIAPAQVTPKAQPKPAQAPRPVSPIPASQPPIITRTQSTPSMDIMRPRQQRSNKLMNPSKPTAGPTAPRATPPAKKQPRPRRPRLVQ